MPVFVVLVNYLCNFVVLIYDYMEQIRDFSQLVAHLQSCKHRNRVAVVCGYDEHSQYAITRALKEGFAEFVLVGEVLKLQPYLDKLSQYENFVKVVDSADVESAAAKTVQLVREGQVDCIMKGIINTDVLLKAILNKECGILKKGRALTHIAALEISSYNKMLFLSDAAVIPFPTLEQRVQMIEYAIHVCRNYGIVQPRIALIHCTEKISPKFPVTMDYQHIVDMCKQGKFGDAIIDGPIDVKCACNKDAAEIKGIRSALDGQADVLIMPDIEAANTFYKALTLFTDTQIADALQGVECPVAVTSRSDSAEIKYNSLAMACLTANNKFL